MGICTPYPVILGTENRTPISHQTSYELQSVSQIAGGYKSGGAPRPPITIPYQQPTVQYTRGPRSKRRSVGTKIKMQPDYEICFTDSDFPPLGSF